MRKQRFLFLIIALGLTSMVYSQEYKSYPVDKAKTNEQGIYYTIPQTQLVFKVKVEKTTKTKGIYASSAYMLGIDNANQKQETVYKIKDINILSKAIANPNNQYFLTFSDKTVVEKTRIGGLKSIIVSTEKNKDKSNFNNPPMDNREKRDMSNSVSNNTMENNTNTAASLQTRPIFEKRLIDEGLLTKYPLMSADKVVAEIKRLRDKQIDILSGSVEGTYINTTVDYMYKQLDEIINGYIALFTGTEQTEEEEYTFTLTPTKPIIVEEDLLEPICKFSEKNGITDLNAKNDDVKLIARIHSYNTTSTNAKIENNKNSNKDLQDKIESRGVGVYYSIPEEAEVSINVNNSNTYSKMMPIIQYGTITYLLNNTSNVMFDSQTGALLKLWK
jgi:hypothetical protein